jgi:hypothetical protein
MGESYYADSKFGAAVTYLNVASDCLKQASSSAVSKRYN